MIRDDIDPTNSTCITQPQKARLPSLVLNSHVSLTRTIYLLTQFNTRSRLMESDNPQRRTLSFESHRKRSKRSPAETSNCSLVTSSPKGERKVSLMTRTFKNIWVIVLNEFRKKLREKRSRLRSTSIDPKIISQILSSCKIDHFVLSRDWEIWLSIFVRLLKRRYLDLGET